MTSTQPHRIVRSLAHAALIVLVIGLFVGVAQACPSCKQALGSADSSQGDLVGAYFWSILFMLCMPFTLLGAFSFSMWRAVKKANAAKAAAEQAATAKTIEAPVAANLTHASV